MTGDLQARTGRGLFWSVLNQVGLQGVQLAVGIILARLLTPAEFGLVAMLAIFIGVSQSLVDSGFGAALIQRQNLDRADSSTVFFFNIGVSVFLAGVLFLIAPSIAYFYGEPLLVSLTEVLSLNIVINAFGMVQTNLLTKRLEFRGQTIATVVSIAIGGGVAILMALRDFGVWSLVGQSIATNLVRTILLWFVSDWRPAWTFSVPALRSMFPFGSRLLASGIIFTTIDNIHSVIIGKLFATAELGLYTQARRLQQAPTVGLSGILSRVAFPVFSEIQDDNERLKRGVKKAITTAVFLNFPLMVGLAASAESVVRLLLTEKWLSCVPYIQLLCVAGLVYPMHVINLNVLIAKGRSDLFFRLEVIKNALVVLGAAVSWPFGVTGLICGQIAVASLCLYLNCYYTGTLIGYPFREQVLDLLPYLGVACVMGMLVYSIVWIGIDGAFSTLLTQVVIGMLGYFVACRALNLSALADSVLLAHRSITG